MIALMLALQDAPAGLAPPAMLDIHFNLSHLPPPSAGPDDIVITARREPDPRLPRLPLLRDDMLPKVQTRLLGGTAGIITEARAFSTGVTSSRIMLNWTTKF